MRLTSLSLRRYGPFEDTTLRFDPAPGRINLVLAPNGTGKSVLRQAFGDLLFGIGAQTPMGFRHGYAGMQLSARGVAPDGKPFAFTRRKGNRNTLTGEGDTPLDQAWLDRLLGRADAKVLGQLFALDTERLRQGGRDLLSSGGVLADALLAAAGGLREASALRRSLEEERDRLAPIRRTATRPFYVALDRWTESRRQLRESYVRPREWAEREQALRDAEALRDNSNHAAAAAAEQLRRLERIRRVRPLLTAHASAAAWLSANPHAPRLPVDLVERMPAVRGAVARAAHTLETAREYLARLEGDAAAIVTDDALLALSEDIQALAGMAGLVTQAMNGLPGVQASLIGVQETMAAQVESLGHTGAVDPVTLVPSPALMAQLRRLVADHAARNAASAGLTRRVAEQQARFAEVERAVAGLPPLDDVQQLEALLIELRREGDASRNLAAAERAVLEAEARLADALVWLPAMLRDIDRLAALDPPTVAALERLSTERERSRTVLERAEDTAERTWAALNATATEQNALASDGTPPTQEELARAREHREAGWNLVFRRLAGDRPDTGTEEAFAGGRPLALAYADAIAAADRIADARWSDAGRASRAEGLLRLRAEQEATLATALKEVDRARTLHEEAVAVWRAAIVPVGLDGVAGLAEVQRLLTAREGALAARKALVMARAALTELRTWQESAESRLLPLLGEGSILALPLLLDRAEAVLRHRRAAQDRHRDHQVAAISAREALRDAEQALTEAQEGAERWRAEWNATLHRLGQAPDLSPANGQVVVEGYERLAESLRELAQLEDQAKRWRAALARFQAGHAALRERLGLPPEPDALSGLRELDRRQRTEAAAVERRTALLERREAELVTLHQHKATLAQAHASLQAAMAEAGAITPEAAEERVALGAERVRQEALRDAAEADLLTAGDGLGLDALRAEAAAYPAEDLEAALRDAEESQREHADMAQAQVATVTKLELELRQLAGDDAAVRAAANEAAAAGQLSQALDDSLLLQVAAGLLDAALGVVQEGGDDALLQRISAAFAELTGGVYTGVSSREDERGVARLTLRLHDYPDEEVEVEGLSEGTRDQLFLALRLVAITDQAASGTVVPFVGDDILQSFDDQRAAAAFRSLLRLSETTQVIVLSHHEHLLTVLERATAASNIHLQRV